MNGRSYLWYCCKYATWSGILLGVIALGLFSSNFSESRTLSVDVASRSFQPRSLRATSDGDNFTTLSEEDEDADPCDHIMEVSLDERCEVAKTCEPEGILDYDVFHFCTMEYYPYISISLFILGLIFAFYLLGTAAEDYFCPTLAKISKLLKMPADVAGVTLLALGNGAPDVFSTFAAIHRDDFEISIGELVGAGVFITTAVVGVVSLVSNCKGE